MNHGLPLYERIKNIFDNRSFTDTHGTMCCDLQEPRYLLWGKYPWGTIFPEITERPQLIGKNLDNVDHSNSCIRFYFISNLEAVSASALFILLNSGRIDFLSFVL